MAPSLAPSKPKSPDFDQIANQCLLGRDVTEHCQKCYSQRAEHIVFCSTNRACWQKAWLTKMRSKNTSRALKAGPPLAANENAQYFADRLTVDGIGQSLRSAFAPVVHAPVPADILELVDKLFAGDDIK